MSMGGGGSKEPKDAKALRQRQIVDMAKLDEEENLRIKALFRGRQGGRAFRSTQAARSVTDSAGSVGGTASAGASIVPATGFARSMGGGGGSGGSGMRTSMK